MDGHGFRMLVMEGMTCKLCWSGKGVELVVWELW